MKISTRVLLAAGLFLFLSENVFAFQPTTHVIAFGGALGHHYSPSNLTVEVGDTIVWNGDFIANPMDSISVPTDAPSFSPVTSGMSFSYVVVAAGDYLFADRIWMNLGMRDTITAIFKPHGSQTNEGREFYLGMIYPNYESIVSSQLLKNFAVYALVATYYLDTIYVSYYDSHGVESVPTRYVIPAHHQIQFNLDTTQLHIPLRQAETPLYAACHIVSKYPITVHFLSRGCNSGASYLALPVLGLGKKYVVASYNDNGNPPAGALYGRSPLPSLSTIDMSAGACEIIATEDNTSVTVTPAATTTGGHPRGQPFNFGLSKGQAYYIRSDGKDQSHDMSGSVITSTAPIVVISGHEDAYLGDISCASEEGRNLLMEQMTPVEYWDTNGFMGIPFAEGAKGTQTCGGQGDDYRAYAFGSGSTNIQADVVGVPGGYNLSTAQLSYGEKADLAGAVDIYSTNGHKISVMQYDERTHPQYAPEPAPSMMTIVPHSRWRTSYNFPEFDPKGISPTYEGQYINIISDSIITVKVSTEGSADAPLANALSGGKIYKHISTTFPSSIGQVFSLTASHPYFIHSEFPLIVYLYGMNKISNSFGGMSGDNSFVFEYATPAGMELNTGVPPAFKVTITDLPDCAGWNVCVTDNSSDNPGVKAVMLADDPDGVYFQRPGIQVKNAVLDPTNKDYTMFSIYFSDSTHGELHPQGGSSNPYCFNVLRPAKLAETKAPVGIIDNNGNGLLIQLYKSAPAIKLASIPAVAKPDSIVFPDQSVGTQVCDTFIVTNTAPLGSGSNLMFNSVKFLKNDPAFSIQSVTPPVPGAVVKPQGTLTVTVCAKLPDTQRHRDSLIISNDCFNVPISLDVHGTIGNILAGDISFGNIDTGKETSKPMVIQNVGTADFTLLSSPVLSDNVDFAIDPAFLALLPLKVKAGKNTAPFTVYYHPKKVENDSATIAWNTDIDEAFTSKKTYSILIGTGLAVGGTGGVGDAMAANTFSVRPNPAPGNTAIVSFSLPAKINAEIEILDVLGRALFSQQYGMNSGEFEIPIGYLSQGIYYVRLKSEDIVLTQKLEVVR